MVIATLIFGLGIGNSSSLPPLIAQTDFESGDVQHVIALCVSFAQATYAFAPTIFSFILQKQDAIEHLNGTNSYFVSIALLQVMAALCIYYGIPHPMKTTQKQFLHDS